MARSPEEQIKRNAEIRHKRAEVRKLTKSVSKRKSKEFHDILKAAVAECGLTAIQISEFSGLDSTTIRRFLKTYSASARMETFLALLRVAGYTIEIKPVDPHDDDFRKYRRVALPPLEDESEG